MKKVIFIIIILFSMQSCLSTKSILKNSEYKPVTFSQEQLNGKYKNLHDLWNNLSGLNKEDRELVKADSEQDEVLLKFTSDESLLIQLIRDGIVLDKFTLYGKIKDNHFSIKRRFKMNPPFFFIYFILDEYKVLLANNAEGDLIFLEGVHRAGMILIMGGGGSYRKSNIIPKL